MRRSRHESSEWPRSALHRQVADEAHQIGEPQHPGCSYLAIEELIEIAVRLGVVVLA